MAIHFLNCFTCNARLREFQAAFPDVRMTTGHMWLDFFEQGGR
jgi:hypothetical protein